MLKNATYPTFGMDFKTKKDVRFGNGGSAAVQPEGNVAINGLGRIGITTFREIMAMDDGLGVTRGSQTTDEYLDKQRIAALPAKLNLVAMNAGRKMRETLFLDYLANDSNWGYFPGKLVAKRDNKEPDKSKWVQIKDKKGNIEELAPLYLHVFNKNQDIKSDKPVRTIRILETRDIKDLPWKNLKVEPTEVDKDGKVVNREYKHAKVDLAIDSTGQFTKYSELAKHLTSGADMALLTAPPKETNPKKDGIPNVYVQGVNHDKLADDVKNNGVRIFSAASCTTTCVSPIIKVLNDAFAIYGAGGSKKLSGGVISGFVQTTHSATQSQFTADKAPGGEESDEKDPGKVRGSFDATIPATTGAAKAVGWLIPELEGKLNGLSARVPVTLGSVAYVVLNLRKDTDEKQVKEILKNAASDKYKGIIRKVDDNTTTRDIIGRHENSLYLEKQIQVINKRMVVIPVFYDNEWGFVRSMTDLARQAVANKPKADTPAVGGALNTVS